MRYPIGVRVCVLKKKKKGVIRDFAKKASLAQVFSCEFCEISKTTFLTELDIYHDY